jgi:hypothetical protein
MGDIVYKFLPDKYALMALERVRLKVSLLSELNDIYDCAPIVGPLDNNPACADGREITHLLEANRRMSGLVCFSKDYRSPLLWGHYAASAAGLALGFAPERLSGWKDPIEIEYHQSRPIVEWPVERFVRDDVLQTLIKACFGTKAEEWGYEEEVRYLHRLDSCIARAGRYFRSFYPIALREVIIGSRSSVKSLYLRHLFKSHNAYKNLGLSISLFKAAEDPNEFKFTRRPCED